MKTKTVIYLVTGVILGLALMSYLIHNSKRAREMRARMEQTNQQKQDSLNSPEVQAKIKAEQNNKDLKRRLEKGKTEAVVNLMGYIQNRLNDPKSFDLLRTKSWVVGDSTIVVMVEYTAKNGFGGTVRSSMQAEADADGNLTKVFEN